MRILVTGGTGFIGQYVVEELKRRGQTPVILDRIGTGLFPYETIMGDVRDANSIFDAMSHVEGWIHLAGILGTQETIDNPAPAAETNILGGLNILRAARQYNLPGVNIAVGNWYMDNTYAISKATMERFCQMYRVEHQLPVTTVRGFNAYGPRQSVAAPFGSSKVRKIVPSFVCRALAGMPIEVYGDGKQIMDMIHVENLAEILVAALEYTVIYGARFEAVDAGTGRPTTVLEIAQLVAREVETVTGTVVPIDHLPMRPGEPEAAVVLADPVRMFHQEEIPLIALEAGIRQTIRWYYEEWLPTWRS